MILFRRIEASPPCISINSPEHDLRILQTGYQVRPLPPEAFELDR